jgi:cytochrome oxidase assembly protein ShyY1
MDNRTYNGQAGYEIWAFFDTDEGSWLVAAGWLAGGNSRSQMPAVVLSKLTQTIEIMVRPDSINPLYGVETNQPIDGGEKQWLVQSLSAQWVNQKWPQVAMLGLAQSKDSELVGVGPTIWQPSVMTVEKHLGYAVQWFGMSIALLGMFLYAGWKQDDNNNKE